MDPHFRAQDVLRCHLCETTVPQYHCDLCHFDLCKACAGTHLLDESREHKIVPIKQRESQRPEYPKCSKHPARQCELFCEPCDVPICVHCAASDEHKQHEFIDILTKIENKKEKIKIDLQELERSIYSKYQEAALKIQLMKNEVKENTRKSSIALRRQGKIWHRKITSVIWNLQSIINESQSALLDSLLKEESKLSHRITEIAERILELMKIQESNDACLISKYKSRIDEFQKWPPRVFVTLPHFCPEKVDRELRGKTFGCLLSKFFIATKERIYVKELPGAESSPQDRTLLNQPKVLGDIRIDFDTMYSVKCKNDEEIWTCGADKVLKLYNLHGELTESTETKNGNHPWDIAITQDRELLYTYYKNGTVNILRNGKVEELIRVYGWNPRNICFTINGDLLVFMNSYAKMQSKVVRYSAYTEIQNIQWDDWGYPIFSGGNINYLTENKNLDICVADRKACTVVVVNVDGKVRFQYAGVTREAFDPVGISTDSQARILVSDCYNNRIHIIDQRGQFLRYIHNCGLEHPFGLCVDSKDKLFVAQEKKGVKFIQYCK
ncbi:uncharacterized protein LOC111111801 [Crassostrea virginica]